MQIFKPTGMYVIVTLCFLIIYTLFYVKENFLALSLELSEVKKQVHTEEDSIKILKAELTYLSSPKRIKELTYKYLNLELPKLTQIINDPLEGERIYPKKTKDNFEKTKKTTNWRYKKGHTKYLH